MDCACRDDDDCAPVKGKHEEHEGHEDYFLAACFGAGFFAFFADFEGCFLAALALGIVVFVFFVSFVVAFTRATPRGSPA
jgi:hypothetical protein